MRIATLMIDGFGTKLPKFLSWLQEPNRPDIVALQKIRKAADFPESLLHRAGYNSVIATKGSQDFGVAILARTGLGALQNPTHVLPGAEGGGARFLTVEIAGILFSSIYAPYGKPKWWAKELGSRRLGCEKAIDERVVWLQQLRSHIHNQGYAHRDAVFCGDFNVKTKSDGPPTGCAYSGREQDELEELLRLGFVDLYDEYRQTHPEAGRGCTYYFTEKYPEGSSRLHLAIASNGLAKRLISATVDKDANIREKTRPLVVEFSDPNR